MLVLKWFLYVFTQWSELMQEHVNISPDWAGSDSRLVVALPRPPTDTESDTKAKAESSRVPVPKPKWKSIKKNSWPF